MNAENHDRARFEYIVVGSGAGGGTVAARLAEAGRTVLVLEAGGDPTTLSGGNAIRPATNTLPDDYHVPVFHANASENAALSWDFFVRHYGDDEQQQKDPKYQAEMNGEPVEGVLYPRAECLGGCTAHNAMITVYPHNQDWDDVADLTGDSSWRSHNMRRYFERLENCNHRLPIYRWLAKLGINPTRHGWGGWLQTEKAIPKSALGDGDLVKTILASAHQAFHAVGEPVKRVGWLLQGQADPNDWRLVQGNAVGVRYPPLANRNHQRVGTRDRLRDVAKTHPDHLTIETDALVTRVLFDENNRAVGVEYLKGQRLYRAHKSPSAEAGELREARASR